MNIFNKKAEVIIALEVACDEKHKDTFKKQLIIDIAEILVQKGLLNSEEKNRIKVIVNSQRRIL